METVKYPYPHKPPIPKERIEEVIRKHPGKRIEFFVWDTYKPVLVVEPGTNPDTEGE